MATGNYISYSGALADFIGVTANLTFSSAGQLLTSIGPANVYTITGTRTSRNLTSTIIALKNAIPMATNQLISYSGTLTDFPGVTTKRIYNYRGEWIG